MSLAQLRFNAKSKHAALARSTASDLSARGIDPAKIQKVIDAIEKFGPGIIALIEALLEIAPAPAPTPTPAS